MDYNQFREQYDFICLQGLKGEGETWEIQDKKTFRLYDYIELDLRDEIIDQQRDYCDHMLTLQHDNLLNMKSYTFLFKEDVLDDPYCKFYMVFEYSESSLFRELQTISAKRQNLKPKKFHNLVCSLLNAIGYLHSKGVCHENIQNQFVCLHEKQGFKLMPNYKKILAPSKKKKSILDSMEIKRRKVETSKKPPMKTKVLSKPKVCSKIYSSPEVYQKKNCRNAFESIEIDKYKSEIFSLGMLLLQAGNLCDLSAAYKTFYINFSFIDSQLKMIHDTYGEGYAELLSKILCGDPKIRPSADECLAMIEEGILDGRGYTESFKVNPQLTKEDSERDVNIKSNARRKASVLLSMFKTTQRNISHVSEIEDGDDSEFTKLIFNTLPQEYQDEIDKFVSTFIKDVEDNYIIDSYTDGSRYQGEKTGSKPSGFGIFYWANGERYEGEFREGKYHGYGIYFWPSGIKHYGQFANGEISGLGVRYYLDGGIYFGEWQKGKNQGRGSFFWPNGSRYSGGFINDNIYGKGILFWPENDGKTVRRYEGLWKDLEKDGIKVSNIQKKAHDDILTEI